MEKVAGSPRPLKVCMRNIESAQLAIKHGKILRQFDTEGYSFDLRRVFSLPTNLRRKESHEAF